MGGLPICRVPLQQEVDIRESLENDSLHLGIWVPDISMVKLSFKECIFKSDVNRFCASIDDLIL
jgi:hypothetical protein